LGKRTSIVVRVRVKHARVKCGWGGGETGVRAE
jgi:hypothetical protein